MSLAETSRTIERLIFGALLGTLGGVLACRLVLIGVERVSIEGMTAYCPRLRQEASACCWKLLPASDTGCWSTSTSRIRTRAVRLMKPNPHPTPACCHHRRRTHLLSGTLAGWISA